MFFKYRELQRGEFVVVGGDCSMGSGDYSVCQFISKNNLDVPLVYSSRGSATEMTNKVYPALERIHDKTGIKPMIGYERNNGGSFEMERLASLNRLGKYDIFKMPGIGNVDNGEPVRLGWDTNTATRPAMLSALKEIIDSKTLRIYDKRTVEELFSFINVQTSTAWKAQAEKNAHDDHVMALAIAWQLYIMSPSPSDKQSAVSVGVVSPDFQAADRWKKLRKER